MAQHLFNKWNLLLLSMIILLLCLWLIFFIFFIGMIWSPTAFFYSTVGEHYSKIDEAGDISVALCIILRPITRSTLMRWQPLYFFKCYNINEYSCAKKTSELVLWNACPVRVTQYLRLCEHSVRALWKASDFKRDTPLTTQRSVMKEYLSVQPSLYPACVWV